MPTLIGLGFSSKVPVSDHTMENHVRWMNKVLTDIEEALYRIGMGALAESPDLLKGRLF